MIYVIAKSKWGALNYSKMAREGKVVPAVSQTREEAFTKLNKMRPTQRDLYKVFTI